MKKSLLYKTLITFLILIVGCLLYVSEINFFIKNINRDSFIKLNDVSRIRGVDTILVLGAGVNGNKPSPMLKDRLDIAITLYEMGVSNKIIMSGDHGRKEYDEVNVMKDYALSKGVPSSAIFMDHAGFSTYDSLYRAKNIFQVKSLVIVSQEYHLYRALYLAKSFDLEAYGIKGVIDNYRGSKYRELREVLARNKDFFLGILKPKSKYLGSLIPVNGNGDITND